MKPERAVVEGLHHGLAVAEGGQHDDRDRRVELAQLPQQLHAVPIGQLVVQQNQGQVGVLADEADRLGRAGGLQDDGLPAQLPQDTAHRLPDQRMVVDHQEFHVRHV